MAGWAGSRYMSYQRRKNPAIGTFTMIAKTFGVMVIGDVIVETIMVRTQLISYGSTIPSLTLFAGNNGFILPGATPASAALDLARTVVRRAERRCVTLVSEGALTNPEARRYLNRLSLVLFVLGRYEEARAGTRAEPARA